MQNKYVGDVGDFAKHGLLRNLSGMTDPEGSDPGLQLGLIWYMYHGEPHPPGNTTRANRDGKYINFLERIPGEDRAEYRDCDPCLWEKLRDLVFRDARCVHCAESAGLLPESTQFFNALLQYPAPMPRPTRERVRELWLNAALEATKDAKLVCVDPDNGIADSKEMYNKKGPKHVYVSDLQTLWERGQSLVVYHHLGMVAGGARKVMIPDAAAKIRDGLDGNPEPIPLWFHRGSARVFFVIPQPCHKEPIEKRVDRFLKSPWGKNGHFEKVYTKPTAKSRTRTHGC